MLLPKDRSIRKLYRIFNLDKSLRKSNTESFVSVKGYLVTQLLTVLKLSKGLFYNWQTLKIFGII